MDKKDIIKIDCLIERENVIDRNGNLILAEELKKAVLKWQERKLSIPIIFMHDLKIPPIGKAEIYYVRGEGIRAIIDMPEIYWKMYRDKIPAIGCLVKSKISGNPLILEEVEILEISLVNENSDKEIKSLNEGRILKDE